MYFAAWILVANDFHYTAQESGGSNRGSQGFQADPSQDSQAAAVSLLVK